MKMKIRSSSIKKGEIYKKRDESLTGFYIVIFLIAILALFEVFS